MATKIVAHACKQKLVLVYEAVTQTRTARYDNAVHACPQLKQVDLEHSMFLLYVSITAMKLLVTFSIVQSLPIV